jgi:hypothetical protein
MNLKIRLLLTAAVLVIAALVVTSSASAFSSHQASAAFKQEILNRRPQAIIPTTEGQACPEELDLGGGPSSLCFVQFKDAGRWFLWGATAEPDGNEIAFSYPTKASWTQRWVSCRLARAPGRLWSNHNCGYGQPETDAYFVFDEVVPNIRFHHPLRSVGWQFTDSAGFDSLGHYVGKRSGKSLVFTNAVGDSFRYKP